VIQDAQHAPDSSCIFHVLALDPAISFRSQYLALGMFIMYWGVSAYRSSQQTELGKSEYGRNTFHTYMKIEYNETL
jgi:hypothetical protein